MKHSSTSKNKGAWRVPFFIFAFLFLSCASVSAQEYFYYYNNQKQAFTLSTSSIYLVSEVLQDERSFQEFLGPDFVIERSGKDNAFRTTNPIDGPKHTDQFWVFVDLKKPISKSEYFEQIQRFKSSNEIRLAMPFFKNEKVDRAGLSQYLYVKLKDKGDLFKLRGEIEVNNAELTGQNLFMPLWYTVGVTENSNMNAMEFANHLFESGQFEFAEPELMVDDDLHYVPNDALYGQQWGLNNTGSPGNTNTWGGTAGIDLSTEEAWDFELGSTGITVAILDQGIDPTHPDLAGNLLPGYDTETNSSPAVVYDNHGTACAGIVAAIDNNSIGVSGVAPNCRLVDLSNTLGGNATSRQNRANGFNWAAANNVDIISNSWGSGAQYAIIDNSITNALTVGRGGLGCIILFSSGNNNSGVGYPANSNPDIVAVGAMSMCAERKRSSSNPGQVNAGVSPDPAGVSCDNELWWGSNFGTQQDIVAPGVKIATTDRQGAAGYNTSAGVAGNYTTTFNGTSSACPMAAGVAALILSANPSLTHDEVEDILELTARKVGAIAYAPSGGRPNGNWNNQMGYGLVSAQDAIHAYSPLTTLFAVNGGTSAGAADGGAVMTVNPMTAASSVVGTPSPAQGLTGAVFGPNGRLFTSTSSYGGGSKLLEVDPNNGALIREVAGYPNSIADLAVDPSTGVLYMIRFTPIGPGTVYSLWTVSFEDGASTFIGNLPGLTFIYSIGFKSDGTLMGMRANVSTLYTLNKATGGLVSSIPLIGETEGATGFVIDPENDVAYASRCCAVGDLGNSLLRININTGFSINVGSMGANRRIHDLTFQTSIWITNDDVNGDRSPDITDPCSCDDPQNSLVYNGPSGPENGDLLFHEIVIVASGAGESWEMTTLNGGQVYDAAGNPLTLSLPMTEGPAGVYAIEFWHHAAVGYDADFSNGVATLNMFNSCAACPTLVPTMGEWGLIFFVLLLMTGGLVALVRRKKRVMA